MRVQSSNHWISREFPSSYSFKDLLFDKLEKQFCSGHHLYRKTCVRNHHSFNLVVESFVLIFFSHLLEMTFFESVAKRGDAWKPFALICDSQEPESGQDQSCIFSIFMSIVQGFG